MPTTVRQTKARCPRSVSTGGGNAGAASLAAGRHLRCSGATRDAASWAPIGSSSRVVASGVGALGCRQCRPHSSRALTLPSSGRAYGTPLKSNVSRLKDVPVAMQYPIVVPLCMKRKHQRTLELIFSRPTSGNVQWRDVEGLFVELGAEVSEREGSRIAVVLFEEVRVFHRPHPSPNTDKGAVASIRKWLEQHGVEP